MLWTALRRCFPLFMAEIHCGSLRILARSDPSGAGWFALSRERYDLVLLNLSDALKLKQPVQSAPSDPLAVPVVNAPDASFQPINERKVHGPAPRGGEAHRSLISV